MAASSQHYDVAIIGGGVIGVCSAYYLARQGQRVLLIEQWDIAAGSSYGNAGLVVPSHSIPLAAPGVLTQGLRWLLDSESPFYIKPRLDLDLVRWLWRFQGAAHDGPMRRTIPVIRDLSLASIALYDQLAALDGLEFGYQHKGVMYVCTTEKGVHAALEEAHLLQEFGLPAEMLNAAQVHEKEPRLLPAVIGGLYVASDAHLQPADFVRGLASLVAGMGVRILTKTEVLGFETAGRSITGLRTTRGDFIPTQVVVAAGAWTPVIARRLRVSVPIQAAKGYSITMKRPESAPSMPLILNEARVGVTPMGDTLRLAGTLELAGLDFSINQRRVRAIQRGALNYLPGLEAAELIEIWRGLRPVTPDGLPILGRVPAYPNLIVAAGHAMIGMSLGPITGQLVAQLATGQQPAFNLHPLRLERF